MLFSNFYESHLGNSMILFSGYCCVLLVLALLLFGPHIGSTKTY